MGLGWNYSGPADVFAEMKQVMPSLDNISWERLLLDLHAARFLGPLAGLFSDLMALLIVVLAVTGYWTYRLTRLKYSTKSGSRSGRYVSAQ